MPDLGPVARQVEQLLAGIPDELLAGPTPCEEYAVRDVLAHLLDLTVAFRDAAARELGPTTATDPGAAGPTPLGDDWRSRLPRRLGEMAEAWRAPGAWEGTTQVGGLTLPAEVAGSVGLNELLLHGWDLARATGQEYACDPASLEVSRALLAPAADAGEGGGDAEGDAEDAGLFGPPVAVPADAPLLDRVVGLSGRRPGWQPA